MTAIMSPTLFPLSVETYVPISKYPMEAVGEETSPLLSLPTELLVTVIDFCTDIDSLGTVAFTCQRLYQLTVEKIEKTPCQLNAIFSRLLRDRNLAALQRFLAQINNCAHPLELTITHRWHELPEALIAIQSSSLQIHGIVFKGVDSQTALDALSVCLSLKKLVFDQFFFSLYSSELPRHLPIEELELLNVSFDKYKNFLDRESYSLAELVTAFSHLKRLIFQDCDNLRIDFERLEPSSNSLEFFSHDSWCIIDEPQDWLSYTRASNEDDFAENPATGISAYWLACHYEQTNKAEKVEPLLQKSILVSPRLVHPKIQLGMRLCTTQPETAEALFRESLAICPEHIPAHIHLGTLLLQTGRLEGLQVLEQAYHLYLQQGKSAKNHDLFLLVKTLCEYAPEKSTQALKQLLRTAPHMTSEITNSPLVRIGYAVRTAEERSAVCKKVQKQCMQRPDLFGLLVSMRTFNEEAFLLVKKEFLPQFEEKLRTSLHQDLFTDSTPWISIFDCLKKSGKSTLELLDNFLTVRFPMEIEMALLQFFLFEPRWTLECRYYFSLLSKRDLSGGTACLSILDAIHKKNLIIPDHLVQDLCEAALHICDMTYIRMMIHNDWFQTQALYPIKKPLLLHILRSDPDDAYSLIMLVEVLHSEGKDRKILEKLLKRAAIRVLTSRATSPRALMDPEFLLRVHAVLVQFQVFPELQKQLFAQYCSLRTSL